MSSETRPLSVMRAPWRKNWELSAISIHQKDFQTVRAATLLDTMQRLATVLGRQVPDSLLVWPRQNEGGPLYKSEMLGESPLTQDWDVIPVQHPTILESNPNHGVRRQALDATKLPIVQSNRTCQNVC